MFIRNNKFAAIAGGLLSAIPATIRCLPLAFVINVIRLHHNTGYERYLEVMVGRDVQSRSGAGALDMAEWGSDLQTWTNARLSYWSDLLSVSLSAQSLAWAVCLAIALGILLSLMNGLLRDLRAEAMRGSAEGSVVRGSGVSKGSSM